MERLHHPHIIRAYEAHEVLQRWHLVMEYAPKGELNSYLKRSGRLDEKTSKNYSSQILSALDHLHNNGVVHRDLKAENVFIVSNMYVKLGDFGFSKCVAPDAALTTFCGSPPYAAPELFVADSYTGPAVDLWALGVLLFYMVTGSLPFKADSLHKIKRLILSGDYRIPAYVSNDCQTLISGLLVTNVERRYTVSQAKSSKWFSDIDWQHLMKHKDPTPDEIDDASARYLLKKWWDVDSYELDKALSEGPKNKLTGIYRILRSKGLQYKKDPTLPDQKYKNKRGRVKRNGSCSTGKNKPRPASVSHKELTTVDLRDQKSIKSGENSTRTCNIL
ncbi:serine/threonine-protein kinase NIM1 [Schistosoma bovis]|uniref:Serine/threonine-protein kinase NIM1 n=1 Tax=Schistosoma bovis TaxID=6184 RepID=A0A430QLR2_SCHBO|nr:serine/threonine-protein kinase NIM1 [Schistosoma bovis]